MRAGPSTGYPRIIVLPRGGEEGEQLGLRGRTLMLRDSAPLRSRLRTRTRQRAHRLGDHALGFRIDHGPGEASRLDFVVSVVP